MPYGKKYCKTSDGDNIWFAPWRAHRTASSMRDLMGVAAWKKLFSFSLVRNPWARFLSLYFYRHAYSHPTTETKKAFKDELVERLGVHAIFLPANTMLCDKENNLLVNFVARYENRKADLAYIGKQIHFPEFGQTMMRNITPAKYDYREYYDDELRNRVEEVCQWEIEQFKYAFNQKST